MTPRDVLQPLLAELADQIRTYQQSRRIYLAPAERSRRIRERQDWIVTIERLLDADETKGTPCTGATS